MGGKSPQVPPALLRHSGYAKAQGDLGVSRAFQVEDPANKKI
jgi:hypothetical protein